MTDATLDFGRLLRARRLALGMTQTDFALFLGTGVRFIVDLEAGKPTCQLGKALRAAEALGVSFAVRQLGVPDEELERPPGQDQENG